MEISIRSNFKVLREHIHVTCTKNLQTLNSIFLIILVFSNANSIFIQKVITHWFQRRKPPSENISYHWQEMDIKDTTKVTLRFSKVLLTSQKLYFKRDEIREIYQKILQLTFKNWMLSSKVSFWLLNRFYFRNKQEKKRQENVRELHC